MKFNSSNDFHPRYPGVQVDVLASARGKQTFELNKNVRWANVYDPDDEWPEPAEYTDMVGLLKVGGFEVSLLFNSCLGFKLK